MMSTEDIDIKAGRPYRGSQRREPLSRPLPCMCQLSCELKLLAGPEECFKYTCKCSNIIFLSVTKGISNSTNCEIKKIMPSQN